MNLDGSKVAFLRTSIVSSTIDRFPLFPMRGALSEVFYLPLLVRCGSNLFSLVANIFVTSVLFPLLPVEVGSIGARFGAMDIWFGLEVYREDEK